MDTASLDTQSVSAEYIRPNRASEIFVVLKERILRWEYPPGYRFTEEAIGKEFEVSRSPVRETLRMLEEHGLVDKIPYRGCTVKQPNLQELTELYEVRQVLEMAVLSRLIARGLPAAVSTELRTQWGEYAKVSAPATVDGASLANADRAFHETLAEAAENRTLYEMLCTINDRLHFIRMLDITTVERLQETCAQHMALLDAIEAGDSAKAEAALQLNIEGARTHVRAAIKEVLARAYLDSLDA